MQRELPIHPLLVLVPSAHRHRPLAHHQEVDLGQALQELGRRRADVAHHRRVALDELVLNLFPVGLGERRDDVFCCLTVTADENDVGVAVAVAGKRARHAGADATGPADEDRDRGAVGDGFRGCDVGGADT